MKKSERIKELEFDLKHCTKAKTDLMHQRDRAIAHHENTLKVNEEYRRQLHDKNTSIKKEIELSDGYKETNRKLADRLVALESENKVQAEKLMCLEEPKPTIKRIPGCPGSNNSNKDNDASFAFIMWGSIMSTCAVILLLCLLCQ